MTRTRIRRTRAWLASNATSGRERDVLYGRSFLDCSFFFSSRRRHTSSLRDWSSDVCSSDLVHVDYRFLFNWYIDVDTWDAMAVLSFPDFAAAVRWKDIEKGSPGGLPRDALEMAWPLNSYSADLLTREVADPSTD